MALFNSESQWRSDSILDSYAKIVFSLANPGEKFVERTIRSLPMERQHDEATDWGLGGRLDLPFGGK